MGANRTYKGTPEIPFHCSEVRLRPKLKGFKHLSAAISGVCLEHLFGVLEGGFGEFGTGEHAGNLLGALAIVE
jgi:hypothetical protein